MAVNYIQSIPKLKGRENYDEWCFAVENLLVLDNLVNYIKSEPEAKFEAKASDDAKAKAKLVLTIDPGLYVHIKETKTSLELWTKLRVMFDDSGFSRKITLLRHLISLRQENCDSMTSYVTQVVETAQRLKGTGFTITEEWIASLLLAGLPEKFSPMIMAIEHSGMQITTDAIKSKLIDMEVSSKNDMDSSGAAFAANQTNSSKKQNYKNGAMQLSNSKVTGDRKTITCYKCKQTGHFRNQCPLLQKNKQSNAFSVVFLNGEYSTKEWYVDSGASAHMTANKEWINNANYKPHLSEITVANNTKVPVLCSGDIKISTDCNYDIMVKDVLCVPNLTTNLLSVSELIKNGNKVVFEENQCYIRNNKNVLVATAMSQNGVYKLNVKVADCMLAAPAVASADLWHRRLAHINCSDLNKMKNGIVNGLSYPATSDMSKEKCVTCCEGKQMRLPFAHVGQKSIETLQIIHADVCGAMETKSIAGSQYFLLFVDDYSRMTFIYFLKHKNEVYKRFKEFKAMVENQQNKKIKILRSDNGGEFCSSEMENYLTQQGIIHQKTVAYTPEQNGVCERANRTVIEKARCLLFDAKLEKRFWAEAANTAVYIKNRCVTASLDNITPYEAWFGKKPDLSNIRLFGCPVMVHVPKEKRLKWDRKAEQHILVGFSENTKGYRVYDPKKNTITVKRDIIVMEESSTGDQGKDSAVWIQKENIIENSEKHQDMDDKSRDSVGDHKESLSNSISSESDYTIANSGESDQTLTDSEVETDISLSEIQKVPETLLGKRTRKAPERFGLKTVVNVPATEQIVFEEALKGPEAEQWKLAMQSELKAFQQNDVWEIVDVPCDVSIVQCKWVLNKKLDVNDKVQYRARLVAKGFTQRQGIDYEDTFSPVVRHSTLRMLFALSVQWGMDITHLDVSTAFLNGHLKENIYMAIPVGFESENSIGKVLKLKRAMYGLKQASLVWYEKVKDCLCNLQFKNSKYEPCLFQKVCGNVRVIVAVYVDDFLIFSNSPEETEKLKSLLGAQFKIKDLGPVRRYLGMRINVDKKLNEITVDQQQYIDQLLCTFNMSDCKTTDTPIECKLNLEKSETCVTNIPFQRLIGSLMYLAVLTRPDIAYAVGYLSQFNNCYNETHYIYAKRILKYLQKTKNYCLKYSKRNSIDLNGFVDADWASDYLDRKSYTGFCFVMCGSVISWQSRKQKTVSLSSTEAEYVALSEATREAVYLRNLLYELTGRKVVIKLYCDNQSALKMATSQQSLNRSKHIDVRYHYVREAIRNKLVMIEYISTHEMPADMLTKGLLSMKHYKFLQKLGVIPM